MKGRCVKCGSDVYLERAELKNGEKVIWVFKCPSCRNHEDEIIEIRKKEIEEAQKRFDRASRSFDKKMKEAFRILRS